MHRTCSSRRGFAVGLLLFIVGCGSGSGAADANVPLDAGGADAMALPDADPGADAAAPPADTGVHTGSAPMDAGARPDTGPAPSACAPACGPGTVCVDGACEDGLSGVAGIDSVLLGDPAPFDSEILISQDPDLSWRPSRIYKWRDFVQAVATMHQTGVGDLRLWLGDATDADDPRARYGLTNLAAFLAQSMKETIQYDACDENNWDSTNGYQISNSCGQLGQSYEDYDCEMACPRDPSMQITAVTHATWYGAPGPMFCAPDATLEAAGLASGGRTGRWDHSHDCWPYPATEAGFTSSDGPAWSRTECEVYPGQRAGRYLWDGSGESVEGCCWWGRGVIQTTGRCNFGTLNHFLGRSHLDPSVHAPPVRALYPDIDFCSDPEVICASTDHPELKWVAGLFYWMSSVQTYDERGWAYLSSLKAFVDGGLADDAFIDAVSGIVNRGCHDHPCDTGPVDGLADRRANFDDVLRAMGLR